jgi:putative addiction module component (TIGR02574 family)
MFGLRSKAMSNTTFSEPNGFSQLSKADQIRYVQMLWDRIAANPNDVAVPDSHWLELQDRLTEYRAHPGKTEPARDVLERLASKTKR